MTNRLILVVLTIGVGYYVLGDLADRPTAGERSLEWHDNLMKDLRGY